MKIKMQLLSDTIFGNGKSIPGAEDISVLCDEYGFPYFKGGTMKGIFRETLEEYLSLLGKSETEADEEVNRLLGTGGIETASDRLVFSDFVLSENVRQKVITEIGPDNQEFVKNLFTNLRTFTSMEDGMAKSGSLRCARCVNQGFFFYSEIRCLKADEELVRDVLALIKNIGSMRNRGFGNVLISEEEQ